MLPRKTVTTMPGAQEVEAEWNKPATLHRTKAELARLLGIIYDLKNHFIL